MATYDTKTENLQKTVNELDKRIGSLATSNSQLLDDVSALQRNYDKLVSDMNSRLEVIHEKLFR
jgi:peptidoglycan hydrolase CwlO-like protein